MSDDRSASRNDTQAVELGYLWKETHRMKIVAELARELPITKLRKVRTSLYSQKREIDESLTVIDELIEEKEKSGNGETEGAGGN